MTYYVFRTRRRRDGEVFIGRTFRGRYRLHPGDKVTEVALHTNDKQVARQRLEKIVKELQQEQVGIIAPKAQREAAQRPLSTHLTDFIRNREKLGRNVKYVRLLEQQLERLFSECRWKLPGDATVDTFETWRANQTSAPKTLNEYLCTATAFFNWME